LPCRNIADDLTLSTYNHAFNLIYCNTIIHCLFVSILIITRYHEACFTVYLPQNLPHLPLLFFFCRRILPQWGNWGYWKNMDTQVRSYYQGRRELLGGPGQICFGGPYSSFFRRIFSGQERFNCFRGTFPNFFTTKFRYLSTLSEKQKYFARKNNWNPTTKWLGGPRAGARGNSPPPPSATCNVMFPFSRPPCFMQMRYTAVQKLYKLPCRHSNGSCGGGGGGGGGLEINWNDKSGGSSCI
jgi:hypothetical protein